MRRFFLMLALLLLTLLISAKLDATPLPSAAGSEQRFDWRAEWNDDDDERRRSDRHSRGRNYPRVKDDEIVFRLADHGYKAVALSGDFNDWSETRMEYVEEDDVWQALVSAERGSLRYVYLMEGESGVTRRTDPANPERARHEDRWVSEIVVDKNHRVRRPRTHDSHELLGGGWIDFQRVDGFSLGLEPRYTSFDPWSPELRGRLGYGFSSDRWNASLELRQPLLSEGQLQATLGIYDITDYTDQTGVGDVENMLSSWIFREDSRDYYRREGLAFGLRLRPQESILVRAEIRSDDHSALDVATSAGWNIGRESFLPNPAAEEGTMRSLWASGQFGDELHHLRIEFEHSDDDFLSSGFDFTRIEGEARTRLRLGYANRLDLRLGGGTELDGTLPVQKRFQAGGIGTVRGYRYQSLLTPDPDRPALADAPFGGAKRLLFNAEYGLGVDDDFEIVLLFDAGRAWEASDADVELSELSTSVGIGVVLGSGPGDDDDGFRIDVVKALEEGSDDILVQARLSRPF